MINRYYFNDENLKIGFKNNLESHNINPANSILSIIPIYPDFKIETSYINKFSKEMATFYARLIKQCKFKCHILFSASFYKINEKDQRSNEIEFFLSI